MRASHEITFCFADLAFSVWADHPLTIPVNFLPFTWNGLEPACRIEFNSVCCLENSDSTQFYDAMGFSVIRRVDGTLYRRFKDHQNNELSYAICECSPEEGVSRVMYLQECSHNFDDLNNCVFHSDWEKLILWQNRLILHAACVKTQLGGILFCGPSGIGKSTQAALWEKYEAARQINGDRTIIYKNSSGWLASGSPYAGSSRVYVAENVPVRAVVILRQGEKCELRCLDSICAFKELYSCSTVYSWDNEYVQRVLDLIQQMIADLPVYELICTPDRAAVNFLKNELMRENI